MVSKRTEVGAASNGSANHEFTILPQNVSNDPKTKTP